MRQIALLLTSFITTGNLVNKSLCSQFTVFKCSSTLCFFGKKFGVKYTIKRLGRRGGLNVIDWSKAATRALYGASMSLLRVPNV